MFVVKMYKYYLGIMPNAYDPSIKSYFLIVSSLNLLRSLRVYVLKLLFFLISVISGFRNIYLDFKE